jgi:hypothetical protein
MKSLKILYKASFHNCTLICEDPKKISIEVPLKPLKPKVVNKAKNNTSKTDNKTKKIKDKKNKDGKSKHNNKIIR